jgi:hypothetical protein
MPGSFTVLREYMVLAVQLAVQKWSFFPHIVFLQFFPLTRTEMAFKMQRTIHESFPFPCSAGNNMIVSPASHLAGTVLSRGAEE